MLGALESLATNVWERIFYHGYESTPRAAGGSEDTNLESILHWKQAGPNLAPIQQGPVRILVLGRAGCGKTYLVETACSSEGYIDKSDVKGNTTAVSSHRVTLQTSRDHHFKLIDPPGFDNMSMSNLQVFSELANYLSSGHRKYHGITGIIYIHRLGDPVESRTLTQSMRVLSELILGESGLSRFTIMLVPSEPYTRSSTSPAQDSLRETIFRGACDKGARLVKVPIDATSIDAILLSYASCSPVLLRIQRDRIRNPAFAIEKQIEATLGYVDIHLIQPRIDEQIKRNVDPLSNRIRFLEKILAEKNSQLARSSKICNQLEQQLTRSKGEASNFHQQLQQTQSEYASLRSQLQLQENIEQSDIVQALKDLNRDIEDVGRVISAHLVDNFVEKIFSKDIGDVTALDARHLPEVKILLGHVEGESSLVVSSTGVGMPVEDFFDYAIRSMLCGHLWSTIFRPFHPGIDASQNNMIASMYEDIQKCEPQAVAGKWRVNSFRSAYRDGKSDLVHQHVSRIAEGLVDNILAPLITYFFGEETGAGVEHQHLQSFIRLVQMAWNWNSMLKQDVVMLGDFHQSFYSPLHTFESRLMEEFEPNAKFWPTSILGTMGLGLIALRAVGGGRAPEETVVVKATVATGSLYA
ncbi:AIG1 domain-containing protein [Ceratobasidium sp. AG-Ba]|nr:AIG1 domain-containing protein [Ceratobasidium sp. AG-Ba]